MKHKRTLAEWIRWYQQSERRRLETHGDRGPSLGDEPGDAEEMFTVIVPSGAPATEIGDDLQALCGVRWSFEITMVPGPDTVQ
jgi:hypothetical protein